LANAIHGVAYFTDIGEFAARLVILLALDRVSLRHRSKPVPDFLSNLIGCEKLHELECKPGDSSELHAIINGFVCFSHFARLYKLRDDTKENLGILVKLNAALYTAEVNDGVNVVIPVILEDGRLGSMNFRIISLAESLESSRIDLIRSSIVSGLFSKDVPSVSIIFNLSPNIVHTCVVDHVCPDGSNISTIILQGMGMLDNFPCLEKHEVQKALVHLIKVGEFEIDFQGRSVKTSCSTECFADFLMS
jgi:hypothetical protein